MSDFVPKGTETIRFYSTMQDLVFESNLFVRTGHYYGVASHRHKGAPVKVLVFGPNRADVERHLSGISADQKAPRFSGIPKMNEANSPIYA